MLLYLKRITFSFLVLFPVLLTAQVDSLPIVAYELGVSDIETTSSTFNQQKVVSGSRTLQSVEDLPLTIYVITKEEIQKYGYVTLVDVLKHLPGIRVSQPGNALEGETFLMRGLKGNSYTKIMINNVPIKPIVASGMPIGAQLPIQQADRIEVIYGPASAVYGTDASAGIINIILDKKERPTFTQARLNSGLVDGYSDLNVLFGGKLGRNKNILSFSVYGSSTILNDRPIIYDADLYDPLSYVNDSTGANIDTTFYSNLSNFKGENAGDFQASTIPHLSRMLGADLYFRNWRLSFQQMYRRDHSAIGLNPTVINYDNPLNYFGENITNVNFAYSKQKKKFGLDLNFSFLRYKVDNRSSNEYINPLLFRAVDLELFRSAIDESVDVSDFFAIYDSTRIATHDFYFSGNRKSYSDSSEVGIEQVYTYAPWKWLELSLGINLRLGAGVPLVSLSQRPITVINDDTSLSLPILPIEYLIGSSSVFFQTYINRPKWNMTIGLQRYDYGVNLTRSEGAVTLPGLSGYNPRITFLYKLNNKLRLRAFYGQAFRVPAPYYFANTFTISRGNNRILRIAAAPLQAEKTTTFETGLRWQINKKIRTDIAAFNSFTDNFISYNFTSNSFNLQEDNSIVGYFNNQSAAISISGIQATFDVKDIISAIKLDLRFNFQYANSFELSSRANGSDAREVPRWSGAAIVNMKPFPRVSLTFLNVYQGSSAVNRQSEFEFGYYLVDGVLRLDLSDKFQALFKVNNILNTSYSGLQATRSLDDLYYNPQPLRTWRIGMSYRTN